MEIEKKYLIDKIPFEISNFKKIEIQQGYISTDPVIRIRKSNEKYYLTVKGEGEMIREEYEIAITKMQFEKLSTKLETNIIKKQRILIPIEEGRTAELDIYDGILNGLMTVEVEFKTENEANSFKVPQWFGREITFENNYKNNMLAQLNYYQH